MISWCLGNPASSNMWHVPELKKIAASPRCTLVELDQCAYGQPLRKRTKLLFWNCEEADILALAQEHHCCGRKVCDFSKKEHVQLIGSATDGRPMTAHAQTCPCSMCRDLARHLLHKHLQLIANEPTRWSSSFRTSFDIL